MSTFSGHLSCHWQRNYATSLESQPPFHTSFVLRVAADVSWRICTAGIHVMSIPVAQHVPMLVKNDCDRRNGRIAKLTTGEPPLRKRQPPETRGPQGHFRYVAAIVLAETTLRANVCYPNSLRLWLRQRVNARPRVCERYRYLPQSRRNQCEKSPSIAADDEVYVITLLHARS